MPSTNGTHLVLQQLAQGIADALDAIARGRLDVAREHLERIQRDLAAGHEVAGSEVPRGS